MLSYVTLDFGTVPKQVDVRAVGNPAVVNLGWYTWSFGTHESAIAPINFTQSILFCPYPNASGINLYMTYPLQFTYKLYGKDGSGLGVKIAGRSLNVTENIVDGINGASNFFAPIAVDFLSQAVKIAVAVAAREIGESPDAQMMQLEEAVPRHVPMFKPYMCLLQLASEIAQWTVMRDENMTKDTFGPFTGVWKMPVPVTAVRQCDVDLSATPTQSALKFGATGLYKCGYVTFEYNNFYSPVQYINQVKQKFFPPAPGATNVVVSLPPSVHATATPGWFTDLQQALGTTLGDVGFMSGVLNGLL